MNREVLVKCFISEIKKKYGNKININYEYDQKEDLYEIWHNNYELQFNDKEFRRFAGNLSRDLRVNKNFNNFSFGYDHTRSCQIES